MSKMASPTEELDALVFLTVKRHPVAACGDRPMHTSCYDCKHRRSIPHNTHSLCAKPCIGMTGSPHGIERGWFMYPLNYDPVWRTSECANFEPVDTPQSATQSAEPRS